MELIADRQILHRQGRAALQDQQGAAARPESSFPGRDDPFVRVVYACEVGIAPASFVSLV